MRNPAFIEGKRAERRATIGQRPMVLGRHGQSAGTARVRPQFTKPKHKDTEDYITGRFG